MTAESLRTLREDKAAYFALTREIKAHLFDAYGFCKYHGDYHCGVCAREGVRTLSIDSEPPKEREV